LKKMGGATRRVAICSIFTIMAGARRDYGSALTLGALR